MPLAGRAAESGVSRESALLVFSAAADCRLHAMHGSFRTIDDL